MWYIEESRVQNRPNHVQVTYKLESYSYKKYPTQKTHIYLKTKEQNWKTENNSNL